MGHQIKTIVGSLILALIVVTINNVINYFFVGKMPGILNIRSITLFIIVFTISMYTNLAKRNTTKTG